MKMKRLLSIFLAFFLLPFSTPAESNETALRALLIGSDTFFTQENTYPIAQSNLTRLHQALSADTRTYQTIHTYYEEIGHITALENAVQSTFSQADENDVSLLYFSTHGTYQDGMAGLYLCDGSEENILSPNTLAAFLLTIPGKKILILDACNSGAFIGRGMDTLSASHAFTGPDVYVITSAGGCEASWQWQSDEQAALSGGSYFADVLIKGLTDTHAADHNQDHIITVSEAFTYLSTNYAASTPQMYPLDCGDFPLYHYPETEIPTSVILSDITFEDTLLTAGSSDLHFSFTVHQPISLYYQLVYYHNGAWDFENAQMFQDLEGSLPQLTPGRKQRSLHLNTATGSDSGYAMIQFFTKENETPVFQGARLLCVQPETAALQLSVETAPAFRPAAMEEMSLLVHHDVPCALSVSIRSEEGKTIKRISYAVPSRPQQLPSPGSTFYWDGRDNQGQPAPVGQYTAYVHVWLGEEKYTAESIPFTLEQ